MVELQAWTTEVRFLCQGITAKAHRRDPTDPLSGWAIEFDHRYPLLPPIFCTADEPPAIAVAEVFALVVPHLEERAALLQPLTAADRRYEEAMAAVALRFSVGD